MSLTLHPFTMTKICTSIEQSKKLIESGIDKTTSDMHYDKDSLENYYSPIPLIGKYSEIHDQFPCWSLAALLNIIGNIFKYSLDYNGISFILTVGDFEVTNKTAVDACYDMIVKLNELKLLQL